MSTLDIRKLGNALILDATPSGVLPAYALSAIDRLKRRHGGLWVGGVVSVSQRGISFTPNRLNHAFHEGLEQVGSVITVT